MGSESHSCPAVVAGIVRRAIDATSREAMLRVYNRERLFRDTDAFASFIIQSRKNR